MIKAMIIDDEAGCIQTLESDLNEHCPDVKVLSTHTNPKEGLIAVQRSNPDLLFLDIDMPFINGFEFLEMIGQIDFAVVFTTAYDQYAVQAFKISAVDYLMKPIDANELKKAVQKVKDITQQSHYHGRMHFLMQQIKDIENNNVHRIALPTFEGLTFINLEDILYCQSDSSYSYVVLTDGQRICISKTLRYLDEILCDFNFFRVHNSFIVNLNYIQKYFKSDGGYLMMNNGEKIRVSRSRKEELLNLF